MRSRVKICTAIGVLLISCAARKVGTDEPLRSIRVIKILPVFDFKNFGKVDRMDTAYIDYYFYKDLKIYRIPYRFDSSINGTTVFQETRFQYFIHQKDSLYGRFFNATMKAYNRRAHIDSITNVNKFSDLQLQVLFDAMSMKLLEMNERKDSGFLHEKYYFEHKDDPSRQNGLLFLSYTTNMEDIPFHLSSFIDSIKKSKVYSYDMTIFGRQLKRPNVLMDTLHSSVKMQRIDNPQKEKVLELIRIYEQK